MAPRDQQSLERAASEWISVLDAEDLDRVHEAVGALVHMKPPPVQALIIALRSDASPRVRSNCAIALAAMNPPPGGEEVVRELAGALQDDEMLVRANAAAALRSIGPKAALAAPALIEALRDPEEPVRRFAANALGAIGHEAEGALSALREVFEDDREADSVRKAASRALFRIQAG